MAPPRLRGRTSRDITGTDVFTFLFAGWALLVALSVVWLWLRSLRPAAPAPRPAKPADPIADTVSKWMHDWERGRA
jgi:hypothetical protein